MTGKKTEGSDRQGVGLETFDRCSASLGAEGHQNAYRYGTSARGSERQDCGIGMMELLDRSPCRDA